MTSPPHAPVLASVSCLDDPVRRRLYEVVCRGTEPVSRDEAARAAGISRAVAVYHLDKLVESGLLTASYRRPAGRTGPGAGRPAKFYARSGREFEVSVPPRQYELAARLLVQAVESDRSGASRVALRTAARQFGKQLGTGFRSGGTGARRERELVHTVLSEHGYEPVACEDGTIRLRNCPFHQLVDRHRDVVCDMNLALIDGMVASLEASGLRPALEPRAGHCCVAIGTGLTGTDLTGTDLTGTDLTGTDLTGTDLTGTAPTTEDRTDD